jgi:hypothetical protein
MAILDDTVELHTTDAAFPNNWFGSCAGVSVILYLMDALEPRFERRMKLMTVVLLCDRQTILQRPR